MAELRFGRFHGLRPAIHAALPLPGRSTVGHAITAHNTRLQDGSLRPFAGDELVQTLSFTAKSIVRLPTMECCAGIFALPYCADIFELPADLCGGFQHIVAFSNDCEHSHVRCDPCTGTSWPLTVAAPTTPPFILSMGVSVMERNACGSTSAAEGCNTSPGHGPEQVAYVYTYVDQFGVESPPSPPSQPRLRWDDQRVTLRFVGMNPPDNAVAVRIYRSVADYPVNPDKPEPGAASFQLVEEVTLPSPGAPLTGLQYVDDLRLCDIAGDLLTTDTDCPPLPCFDQVVLLETGYYVGFRGNDIFMSERHEPWNWPERYRITLPDRVVGLAAWNNHYFVGTTGHPYYVKVEPKPVATERIENAAFDTVIAPMQYPHRWPLLQKQAMVATPTGVLYPTHHGLVALRPGESGALITRHRIDPEQWMNYAGNIAAWHDGRYIAVQAHTGRGLILDVRENGEGGATDFGDIVTVDLPATVLHAGRDGYLYYVAGRQVRRAFRGPTARTYRWRSRPLRAAARSRMGAAKVMGEFGAPVTFRLYADKRLVYVGTVNRSTPFRLPPHGWATDFEVELEGAAVVTEVHVGPSIRALATDSASSGTGQGTGAPTSAGAPDDLGALTDAG